MGTVKSGLVVGVIIGMCGLVDGMYLKSMTQDTEKRTPFLNISACNYMVDQLGYCGAGYVRR
jgi:hypothetical protein